MSEDKRTSLLIARTVPTAVANRAAAEFHAFVTESDMNSWSVVDFCKKHDVPAVLIGKKSGLQAEHIAALPSTVKIIANASAGFDHMDVAAAREKGIVVTNAPDALTECTADFSMLLLLAACRRASEYERIMRNGWGKSFGMTEMLGMRVNGKTLGIVGFGRIGRAVAKRAQGFGMRVIYTDMHRAAPSLENGATFYATLDEMLPHCQVLTLHVPGGSVPLMTKREFGLLPAGAIFVNAARGGLVDEDALYDALTSGHLFSAALDVYRNEPNVDKRFAELDNVFLTPHMASATIETRDQMGFTALDNIAAVLEGRPASNPV
ncbi:lactate dehydrogenase-like 2-hydroxyacid dehydrogenase [Paraburkholderia sp. HC6.4b]|uniref:2-hydroxyacid dehydrogenase n=1 Tax=unclassified Paraburkholderia TaxID=2615204 RepID=UPI0016148D48|nr:MULTISPECIES: D-glycerate dehydrogenase [unclassified Paraburkholderia]MBB5409935.1 lactate dehydrogenase-like 2-hydroxyacid dehydrogenase [Paraburkholderia sp. HC6.4b]MBB5451910.1 lactate dehydrogenase-like 2-hydroxyacid dehydrogenase [Paraburkholderia sp. Kb1A]